MANKQVAIELAPGWVEIENPDGPATFVRGEEDESGALQISIQALYEGGEIPNPTFEDLMELAEGFALSEPDTEIRGRASGECALGRYGTVLAANDECAWMQTWVLSNGKDFVLATHTSVDEPSEDEVNEASWIVKNATLD